MGRRLLQCCSPDKRVKGGETPRSWRATTLMVQSHWLRRERARAPEERHETRARGRTFAPVTDWKLAGEQRPSSEPGGDDVQRLGTWEETPRPGAVGDTCGRGRSHDAGGRHRGSPDVGADVGVQHRAAAARPRPRLRPRTRVQLSGKAVRLEVLRVSLRSVSVLHFHKAAGPGPGPWGIRGYNCDSEILIKQGVKSR